jgi:hypothetical protein
MFIVFYKVKILYTLYIYDLLHSLMSFSHSYESMEYLCVCVCVCVCVGRVCAHTHTHTYIYIYVCVFVYIYKHTHTHIHTHYQLQWNQSVMPISEVKGKPVSFNVEHQNL